MAIGGGTFTAQNKILPGAYINFVSASQGTASLSDRGIATLPLSLDWGPEGTMFAVEAEDVANNALKTFGYAADSDSLKPIREIFRHAQKVYFYRLNSSGVKATCTYADAKYPGTVGNSLKIVITANEDSTTENPLYDVSTYLGTKLVDKQDAVSSMSGLENNDFVDFKAAATIQTTAGTALTGGTTGTVQDSAYQSYLDAAESYSFNAMGCLATTSTIKALFAAYCQRMRDSVGKKFQVVLFNQSADYEGVVNLKNGIVGSTSTAELIPWVTGLIAGAAVNAGLSNTLYDGEYTPYTSYTQTQLETALNGGFFTLHNADGEVRVLADVNSLTTVTTAKGEDFKSNQVIRVLDRIAVDVASIFNTKYLGTVSNNAAGRISLWNDIVTEHQELEALGAIDEFDSADVVVAAGQSRSSVTVTDAVRPLTAMDKLYVTITVN